jgi:hypothetical protein
MNFITTKLMGGLGNYLFQIATAYSVSLRDNKQLLCDNYDIYSPHKPYNHYTTNIFRNLNFINIDKTYHTIYENGFEYTEIPKITGNVKINGYFQSEKYFINYKKEIKDLFKIDDETNFFLLKKYSNIISLDTCSIHVRRGDYLKLPNIHPTQNIEYYNKAVGYIGENKHYLIFSDDIEWCKNNLNFIKNKTFIFGNSDFQDLYLMSLCKNNIIANSTFSWWGAWLNNYKNKVVVAPELWFGNEVNYNTYDLIPNNWIKI